VKRRDLITVLGGATLMAPVAARAQQKAMPVIGILNPGPPVTPATADVTKPFLDALRQGLATAGYVEGQNVALERRFAEGHYERLPALAADLVSRGVDVILTNSTAGALAAKNATSTVPIVFNSVGDPVGSGLVDSLARPGGNLTGFSNFNSALAPKVLDVLSEVVPHVSTVTMLVNPKNPYTELVTRSARDAARTKGVALSIEEASTEGEIDAAFAAIVQARAGSLVVEGDPFFSSQRQQIVALASRDAIPTIYLHLIYVAAGGLMVYGIDEVDTLRQSAIYVGRILKGARPADLPVQQPTTLKLIVNLKTAKALGLTVPQSILAQATEVIE
jgi:putative tryptophan/tyrosine transport system substrate-binding protein